MRPPVRVQQVFSTCKKRPGSPEGLGATPEGLCSPGKHHRPVLISSSDSVAVAGGRADCPVLHLSVSKQGVDQRSQHVDGSGDVKHRLPLFQGVLGILITGLNRKSRFSHLSVTNSPLIPAWSYCCLNFGKQHFVKCTSKAV